MSKLQRPEGTSENNPAFRCGARAFVCLLLTICLAHLAGPARASEIDETFSNQSPTWHTAGDASLFTWSEENQNLEVTWDSTKLNSYWYLPLGMTLNRADDFSFRFTLKLDDIVLGIDPEKTQTFELAVGLINTTNAFDPSMFRGAGINPQHGPRNLIEFDYFPGSIDIAPTVAPTVVSKDNRLVFSDNHPLEITTGDVFEIELSFSAATQTLTSQMWKNGEPFGPDDGGGLRALFLGSSFSDFNLNAFAICSYSDDGQPVQGPGSILAHGIIDDIHLTLPDPPACTLSILWTEDHATLSFNTDSKWFYTVEASDDLRSWTQIGDGLPGTGNEVQVNDLQPPARARFYRVQLERP